MSASRVSMRRFRGCRRQRGHDPERVAVDVAVVLADGGQASAAIPLHSCLTISTEISTAVIVPLFSSQWDVFRSSGQPAPGA
jgi:hypothetical protein